MDKLFTFKKMRSFFVEVSLVAVIVAVILQSSFTQAQPAESDFQRTTIRSGLDLSSEFEISRDGRVFVVGKCGAFYGWNLDDDSNFVESTVPNVRCGFEDGLLSIALDPDFTTNGWVYLQYTAPGRITRVSRFIINSDNSLDTASENIVLEWSTNREAFGHMGGSLQFGPDGNLFVSTGDNLPATGYYNQEARTTSGNTNDLRGKILRITPTSAGGYTIPSGNLFATDSTHRGEIYGMGFRNPYRISVDQETGWVYMGDIGPDAGSPGAEGPAGYDELNQLRGPGNFGWPYVAGYNEPYVGFDPNNLINEHEDNTGAFEIPPAQPAWWRIGHRAIMAGPLYRYDPSIESSRKLPEYFDGKLIYWDFNSSNFFAMSMDENGDNPVSEVMPIGDNISGAIDVELDPRTHQLYVLQWGSGCCDLSPNEQGALYRYDFIGDRAPRTNLALGRSATASSVLGGNVAADAFDGDPDTRWESEWGNDPEWLQVDLGASYAIEEVVINWEGAYSSEYQIEGSNDQTTWELLAQETNGGGGVALHAVTSTSAYRYIRITGTARNNNDWGHSLWEFEIYENETAGPTPTPEPLAPNAYLNMPRQIDANFTDVPQYLSDTGAFSDTVNLVPAVHLIPYQPNTQLWSDRAEKYRWLSLPDGGEIQWDATENWQYPEGTVAVKHFELPLDENNPSVVKRLETRLIVMQANGRVYGVTYKWNDAGTDAELLTDEFLEDITITDADGQDWVQTWAYPSPAQCLECHTAESSQFLGLSTRQLNGNYDYPIAGTENQLAHINDLGRFNPSFNNADISSFDRMVAIDDGSASLEERIKSYLDVNCANCHGTGNGGSQWDARFNTPLNDMQIVNAHTTGIRNYADIYGLEDAMMVRGQSPLESILYIRDRSTDPADRMPPIGRSLEHEDYIIVLEEWINTLPADASISIQTPANNQIYLEGDNVSLLTEIDDDQWFSNGGSYRYSINGGQATEVTSSGAVNLGAFDAGDYTISVELLDSENNPVGELVSRAFSVVTNDPSEPTLLSLNRPATSSSNQGPLEAGWAVDGSLDTRWGSEQSDIQWLEIDLEAGYDISNIVISWEAAFASAYTIEGSLDGSSWTTIVDQNNGAGCLEIHDQIDGTYRYIRINMEQRGTEWGYSIWEFQVFGLNN